MIWIAALTLLWGLAAMLAPRRPQRLADGVRMVLIACGIPLLGGLTWVFGPWVGLGALVAGTLLLSRRPMVRSALHPDTE